MAYDFFEINLRFRQFHESCLPERFVVGRFFSCFWPP
jgi:hypothetical protein